MNRPTINLQKLVDLTRIGRHFLLLKNHAFMGKQFAVQYHLQYVNIKKVLFSTVLPLSACLSMY